MSDLDRPLVCALDFSEGSEAALVRAADLAERLHARLHLLHVSPVFQSEYGRLPQPAVPETETKTKIRSFAERVLGGPETVEVLGPVVSARDGAYAGESILSYTREVGAGLLVLGTHGRQGVRHLLIGSVAEEVVRLANCPVLTVPNASSRTAPGPDAPVLVPVDFSAPSLHALALAKTFAASFDAPVELVHVLLDAGSYPPFYLEGGMLSPNALEEIEAEARDHLAHFDNEVDGKAAVRYHVLFGVPHREIATLMEEGGYGLTVMATHGLTGLRHALLGSVTERTLRRACCPVLSVRMDAERGRTDSLARDAEAER